MSKASPAQESEGLFERVGRMKARWLQRVMYDPELGLAEKCFAYVVFDHLNCVTLDCWPAQPRIAKLLGRKSIKTAQRAALGLEHFGLLFVNRSLKNRRRYAPAFVPDDETKSVRANGHRRPANPDRNVQESSLQILSKSSSTEAAAEQGDARQVAKRSYEPRQRGAIEMQLVRMLGLDGLEILTRLAAYDDAIVERLCRAYAAGSLTERELTAARLAAEQM